MAAQWKRKAQKAASDANDVRLLLDEQGAKAVLLERRQRKFDAECQQLREEARRERQTRERAQRDYDTLLADKCALDQQLAVSSVAYCIPSPHNENPITVSIIVLVNRTSTICMFVCLDVGFSM